MPQKLTAKAIRKLLEAIATEERRIAIQKFFKEPVDAIGVKTPDVRPISREVILWCKDNGGLPVAIKLAKTLWKRGKLEERAIACACVAAFKEQFTGTTWRMADDWVDDLKEWASCDNLCLSIVGEHLDGQLKRRKQLVKWTRSKKPYRRRAAAVSLVNYARVGKYLADVWRVAELLMPDEEDIVQKGVGWLLREAARTVPEKVVKFCRKHESCTSRLVLRTAAETMNEKWRVKLLGKKKRVK